jgi:pyruvate/2-oxoglutarate dehydrogenase complex dihydrolipoamide acyltransferase (E2) component
MRRGRRRMAPWMASAVIVLGALAGVGCGDSDDDGQSAAANTTAAKPAPAATTQDPAATAPATTQAQPAQSDQQDPTTEKGTELYNRYTAEGTVRLAAIALGTPGVIKVKPVGIKYSWDHYYPKGSTVTLTAEDTKAAKFVQWSGECTGQGRTCKVTMDNIYRAVAGFTYNSETAKSLDKDSPLLKPGTSDGTPPKAKKG